MMNNLRLLTDKELEYLNDKYTFALDRFGNVVVGNKYYNRKTVHDATKTFSLNTKVKRISFNPMIISLWKELNEEGTDCTLFDVKQAITKLYIMYQELSKQNVEKSIKEEKK